ncbi:Tyrosine recombinase XerC [Streptomyces sp. RB5]|uniref:Tyrosine recombinase XerC n=1 Tax=Streptomyces smaragdinus TaxID=2585196 RepID=A0A7K0CUA2_9ACTN|nr:Tyrosine recombinase XerC [Streptomyces smaragdinus]
MSRVYEASCGVAWSETGYIFATRNDRPVEPRNVYRSFTRVAAGAGVRVIRLHDARHGCATLLTAAGVAPRVIMEMLGHSQISITMDVYTHVVHDTQREAISHMDQLLKRRRPTV